MNLRSGIQDFYIKGKRLSIEKWIKAVNPEKIYVNNKEFLKIIKSDGVDTNNIFSGFTSGKYPFASTLNNKPVTLKTIKQDDDIYSDRGYTEYEFEGRVYYEISKE